MLWHGTKIKVLSFIQSLLIAAPDVVTGMQLTNHAEESQSSDTFRRGWSISGEGKQSREWLKSPRGDLDLDSWPSFLSQNPLIKLNRKVGLQLIVTKRHTVCWRHMLGTFFITVIKTEGADYPTWCYSRETSGTCLQYISTSSSLLFHVFTVAVSYTVTWKSECH